MCTVRVRAACRYAIDFPEDSYLKAVQRVAYVTIFEPGSSELKELEHLFQQVLSKPARVVWDEHRPQRGLSIGCAGPFPQIKSTEDKEFDLEYALAMVEAEIRAQMEVGADGWTWTSSRGGGGQTIHERLVLIAFRRRRMPREGDRTHRGQKQRTAEEVSAPLFLPPLTPLSSLPLGKTSPALCMQPLRGAASSPGTAAAAPRLPTTIRRPRKCARRMPRGAPLWTAPRRDRIREPGWRRVRPSQAGRRSGGLGSPRRGGGIPGG